MNGGDEKEMAQKRYSKAEIFTDPIVNTANQKPIYASGTDKAIYEAAGTNGITKLPQFQKFSPTFFGTQSKKRLILFKSPVFASRFARRFSIQL